MPKNKMIKQKTHDVALNAEAMVMNAVSKGVSVEVIEKVVALAEKIKAQEAKEKFDKAMLNFQRECPEIKKTKEVKTKAGLVAYSYAPLESIVKQVKELLFKNGLSYSVKVAITEKGVASTCFAKHIAGHSEESTMEVPLGNKTEIMSLSQVTASAASFAKRYAFCNVFGIMTGDGDDEQLLSSFQASRTKSKGALVQVDILAIKKILGSCMTEKALKDTWVKLPAQAKSNPELIKYAVEIKNNILNANENI